MKSPVHKEGSGNMGEHVSTSGGKVPLEPKTSATDAEGGACFMVAVCG